MAIIEDGIQEEAPVGGTDGIEAKEDAQNIDPQSVEGNEPDPNGGTENPEAGENVGEVEGQASTEDPVSKPITGLELSKFREDLLKDIEEKVKPAEAPPRELTEEEWAKHESEWGIPRQSIQKTLNFGLRIKNEMQQYIDSKFAAIEKDATVERVAKEKGFSDYSRLKPDVDNFLKAYDPKHHSNPTLIEQALFYARGRNSQKDMRTVRNMDEKNRQIVTRMRPGRPDVGGQAPKANKSLTEAQREAAELLPGGVEEYLRIKNNRMKPIAV